MLSELERRVAHTFGLPQAASTALAVVDGAGRPLTPSEISERLLVASATMTTVLDLLEHRTMSGLSEDEKAQLIDMLGRILKQSAELAVETPQPLAGRRNRPSRLGAPQP